MIAFACEWCGKPLKVDAAQAGRSARCDRCQGTTRVPDPRPASPPPVIHHYAAPVPPPAVPPRRRWVVRPKVERPQPQWVGVERDGWVAVAGGLALSMVPLLSPRIGFLLFPLKTIVHESGHTATAWLLASPAFPQFDLVYGGGYSHVYGRSRLLLLVAYLLLASALYRARSNRAALVGWSVAVAVYSLVMFTPLRDLSILAMGHGAELLIAGLFLYRALTGSQVLTPVERPLYAALACLFVLGDARFALGLMTDDDARVAYGQGKGGGHIGDFDRIAKLLGCPLQRVAGLFLLACLATPVATYLVHRYRDRLWKMFAALRV